MFQNFDAPPETNNDGHRLTALRGAMAEAGVHAFLIPRTDRFRGENVAACDERLAWLTGFTGSAGLAAVTDKTAAIFIDSRYTLQVSRQVHRASIVPLKVPDNKMENWLSESLEAGQIVGFDPWLHTPDEVDRLKKVLGAAKVTLKPIENLVDRIWADRPAPPRAEAWPHPETFSGQPLETKIKKIARQLELDRIDAVVLSVPESIAWLLNIRGADISNTPVVHGACILYPDRTAKLFIDQAKVTPALKHHLGETIAVLPFADFDMELAACRGRVQLDRSTVPEAVRSLLCEADIVWRRDPCVLPKARKNDVELDGARRAAARDGAAVISFLAWLDRATEKDKITEISAARKLEECRQATNALRDLSFDTISGAGANGAIVHYRVTEATDARLYDGTLYLVDSGGQYSDGTTDITRTVAIGAPPEDAVRAFTLVLKGVIGISALRWPEGLAGRDIDAVARLALWQAGMDYGHGTGHGVGSFLSVHEGPQSLSRRSGEPLLPGMILSNEPGYYKEGAYGIRIENLLVVRPAEIPEGGEIPMLGFETLTYVPIDRNLIDRDLLSDAELAWIDAYHAEVFERHQGALSPQDREWLALVTAPL